MKKRLLLLFVIALPLMFGLVFYAKKQDRTLLIDPFLDLKDEQTVLYVSDSCSHCEKVEEWLKARPEVVSASGLIIKEVSKNESNAQELLRYAKECKAASDGGIQLPFLYSKGKCFVGEGEIERYLESL